MCQVGRYNVYILTEHQGQNGIDILIDAPDDVVEKYAPDGTFANAVNAVLIEKEGEVWLADTGFGRNIFTQMASVGITSADVDHLLLTHMHGDHIGGMLIDGEAAFPNAGVTVAAKEHRYWFSETEMMTLPENNHGHFRSAQNALRKYGNKVITAEPLALGNVPADGIHMLEAYGHTPGHVMFLVKDGDEELIIWGDITHAMAVQMPHPEISVKYDVDPDAARETRLKVLDYVSGKRIPVAGMHIPFSGIGVISKSGSGGYEFTGYTAE